MRNHNEGHAVTRLEYEAFAELAEKEGARIVAEAHRDASASRAPPACIASVRSALGDVAVWVGVSAPHRDEAFRACRFIIDEVKHRVPIWKKEHYVNGDSGWVNCERCAAPASASPSMIDITHAHASHDTTMRLPAPAPDYSRQMALHEVGAAGQERLRARRCW